MRPLLPWDGQNNSQVIRLRFEGLARQCPQVARIGDVGLYYLPYTDEVLSSLDHVRVICLKRDRQETVDSFIRWIQQTRKGRPVDHWSADRAGLEDDPWDASFPKYVALDMAEAIGQYWDDYYAQASRLAQEFPDRVRVFEMRSTLNDPAGIASLLDWAGIPAGSRHLEAVHEHRSTMEMSHEATDDPRHGSRPVRHDAVGPDPRQTAQRSGNP